MTTKTRTYYYKLDIMMNCSKHGRRSTVETSVIDSVQRSETRIGQDIVEISSRNVMTDYFKIYYCKHNQSMFRQIRIVYFSPYHLIID